MNARVDSLQEHPFLQQFKGTFSGILQWHQLDDLWQKVLADDAQWYIYAVGEVPPQAISDAKQLKTFIHKVDKLLREEHDEDYCGIVYADNRQAPSYIKIFDPSHLGSSCGSSAHPPLPAWILSKQKPIDLPHAFPQPGNRKRWWQKVFN